MSNTRRVIVVVTDEDIAKGRRHEATRCPVRRAMRRAGIPVRAVFDTGYEFDDSPEFPFPSRVGPWIRRYDAGVAVFPFTFTVGMPA